VIVIGLLQPSQRETEGQTVRCALTSAFLHFLLLHRAQTTMFGIGTYVQIRQGKEQER